MKLDSGTNVICFHLHVGSKKRIQWTLQNRNWLTDFEKLNGYQKDSSQWVGRDRLWVCDRNVAKLGCDDHCTTINIIKFIEKYNPCLFNNNLLWKLKENRHTIWYFFFFFSFFFVCSAPRGYGGSQARGGIRAVAASLSYSHSNAKFKPCLWPTPLLMAILDP